MDDKEFLIYIGFAVIAIGVGVGILIFAIPAIQAKRRGYSFFVWLLAGILIYNPIYLLVVLGVVPHRKRQKMREQFRRELNAKLATAAPATGTTGPIPDRSLGDQPTAPPGLAAASDGPERSIGDAATVMPPARSIGDEMTRS
jgi:hypothetical protein